MGKTTENLKAAFAGESQANRSYLAFAKKADQEGYSQAAKLFRAAAAAETVHALNHFRTLGNVKSTADNLRAAVAGENHEVVSMYPEFIKQAEADGDKKALTTFSWAWEVEKTHEKLYKEALDRLGKETEPFDYWVCLVCGHTHEAGAPDKCPVCNAPASKFERID